MYFAIEHIDKKVVIIKKVVFVSPYNLTVRKKVIIYKEESKKSLGVKLNHHLYIMLLI
jgi:hypothetical protein